MNSWQLLGYKIDNHADLDTRLQDWQVTYNPLNLGTNICSSAFSLLGVFAKSGVNGKYMTFSASLLTLSSQHVATSCELYELVRASARFVSCKVGT